MNNINNFEQPNFNIDMLRSLGFTNEMINTMQYIISTNGKLTPAIISQYGIPYETARDIKYMYDIAIGKVVIDSEQDLIKHLRRMFGKNKRIGIDDLALSKIKDVPRMAVVGGIKQEPYTIYNSKEYPPYDRLYKVVNVSNGNITVLTPRKPQIKHGTPLKTDVLEIKGVHNGEVVISFSKKVCRLCNRFIIVASLRRPEFHHGLVEIICIEGTKVYVYAQTLKPSVGIKYNYGTQRVYEYGFLKPEINKKLMRTASQLYPIICGVVGKTYAANMDYITIPPEQPVEKPEEAVLDDDI